MAPILLRPHHGLCVAHFIGKGYNDAFVQNMHRVIQALSAPDTAVTLICGADAVCTCCPNHISGTCQSEPKPAVYDERVLYLCGLTDGQTLPWAVFKETVFQNILAKGRLAAVCEGCCWLTICASFYPSILV